MSSAYCPALSCFAAFDPFDPSLLPCEKAPDCSGAVGGTEMWGETRTLPPAFSLREGEVNQPLIAAKFTGAFSNMSANLKDLRFFQLPRW